MDGSARIAPMAATLPAGAPVVVRGLTYAYEKGELAPSNEPLKSTPRV